MRSLARWFAAMLLVVTSLGAAGQPERKFRASGANAGLPSRYRVHLALKPGDELETIIRQLTAPYGGRLEPYAEVGFEGFMIVVSETRARLLSSDPRVVPPAAMVPPPPDTEHREPGVTVDTVQPRLEIGTEAIPGFGTYAYDGSGNITSIADGTGTDSFLYDRLGRLQSTIPRGERCRELTAGQPCRTQEFTYDRYGNILTILTATPLPGAAITQVMGVDPLTNQIDKSEVPNANVLGTYDGHGNLVTYNSGQLVYDGLDLVTEATVDGTRRMHVYSASDERVVTVEVNNVVIGSYWTIRDAGGRVLRRLTQDGQGHFKWAEDYVYRDGQLLAAAVPSTEKVRHFHLDHLGTPRLITGNGGAEIAQHQYFPFGVETSSSINDGEKAKFTGHERDAATLDYMHARYYDPYLGRFLSVDPGRDWDPAKPQSWNMYSYVRNNPINSVDPTGRWGLPWELLDLAAYQQSSNEWKEAYYEFKADPSAGRAGGAAIKFLVAMGDGVSLLLPVIPAVGGHTQRVVGVATEAVTGVQANKRRGDAFRDQLADGLRAEGRDVKTEVVKKTPFGPRRLDLEVSQNGRVLGGIETKTGKSRYTASQRAKDWWLRLQGYIVNVVREAQ